ncbi:hypothetical protein RJ55_03724 [Drechmeria coniospora]|nr:hypothetical protein RJ55_03724 [Drechmeria coniospora]
MPSTKDIKRALARIRAVMPQEKTVGSRQRNIRLGLDRISRAIPAEQNWIGVHVGGTNGKGSICALLAGMFRLAGISHGTFVSPAMPERHNGVTINGLYVNKRMYETERQQVEAAFGRRAGRWLFSPADAADDGGELTPFELDTATAFRVFNKMHVRYGVVEVGMGGSTDATNAMRSKAVTVISKIDLDHQEYLGNSIEEIASVKAGIMRPGVPCIVDHTNAGPVLAVLQSHAQKVGTQISLSSKASPLLEALDRHRFPLEDYERQNLLCATLAFKSLFPHLDVDANKLLGTKPHLPGRKEYVKVTKLTGGGRQRPILVDGAHNMLGVEALSKYVESKVRRDDGPVSWVLGLSESKSKPFSRMLETLLRPQDNLAFVEYTAGTNDPLATPADLGRAVGKDVLRHESQLYEGDDSVAAAVQWACAKADEGPVVVAGSLYLVRELYKTEGVERGRKTGTRRPGRAQLWHYTQLSQTRPLSAEEAREFKQARRHWYLSPRRTCGNGAASLTVPVPGRTRQLQRVAAHHRNQADGYRSAIKSMKKDMEGERASVQEGPKSTFEELQRRRDAHLASYSSAMSKIRGRSPDPEKKHRSREEIFGWREAAGTNRRPSKEHEHGDARGAKTKADVKAETTASSKAESMTEPKTASKTASSELVDDGMRASLAALGNVSREQQREQQRD